MQAAKTYPLDRFGQMALRAWPANIPDLYRRWEADGSLRRRAYLAQERTKSRLASLMEKGLTEDEASEAILPMYILLTDR
jgi:hypothetical protein